MSLYNSLRRISCLSVILIIINTQGQAQSEQTALWPKVIPLEQMSITIYQPEAESFDGNTLQVRSAFNIYDGTRLPVFGAIWFKARVHIDRNTNSVFYENIEMVDVNFPDVTTDKKEEFNKLLEAVIPTWQFNSSLKDFTATIDDGL